MFYSKISVIDEKDPMSYISPLLLACANIADIDCCCTGVAIGGIFSAASVGGCIARGIIKQNLCEVGVGEEWEGQLQPGD
jgi:hypothetical protein